MLIVNKGPFAKGALLMVTFLAVFAFIMSPMFKDQNGQPQNGLQFSDDFFNKLAKNSSDYFDTVKTAVAKYKGKQVAVTATVAKPDPTVQPDPAKAQETADKDAQTIAKALTAAGAQVEVKANVLTVKGDLGAMGEFAYTKSVAIYNVIGMDAEKPENVAARKQLKDLWKGFSSMVKPMQKDGKVADAKFLDVVMKKAIEPAYNFYGVPGEPVSKNMIMLLGLLAFYVLYTMWYGYGIFYMFEGIGMSMKKSRKKH